MFEPSGKTRVPFKVFFYHTFMQHLYKVIYLLFVGQIYILKTVRWSMHLEISVDPTKPLGHRARLIGPGLCLCYVFVLSSMSAKFACTFNIACITVPPSRQVTKIREKQLICREYGLNLI